MSCHGDALLSPQQVVCRLLFALDCCGLCLDPGVQTVPAVNTGSILLNVHPHAPGQAHSKQEEVSCMVEVPLISSLPPAFFFCCFAPFLLSQSDRTQISKYHLSFYYFFFLMQNFATTSLGLSRLSKLISWAILSTSPFTYTTEFLFKLY